MCSKRYLLEPAYYSNVPIFLMWHFEFREEGENNSVEEILPLGWINSSMRKAWGLVVKE